MQVLEATHYRHGKTIWSLKTKEKTRHKIRHSERSRFVVLVQSNLHLYSRVLVRRAVAPFEMVVQIQEARGQRVVQSEVILEHSRQLAVLEQFLALGVEGLPLTS